MPQSVLGAVASSKFDDLAQRLQVCFMHHMAGGKYASAMILLWLSNFFVVEFSKSRGGRSLPTDANLHVDLPSQIFYIVRDEQRRYLRLLFDKRILELEAETKYGVMYWGPFSKESRSGTNRH